MTFKRIAGIVSVVVIAALGIYAWFLFSVPRVSSITMVLEEAVETLLVSGRVTGEGAVPLSFEISGTLVSIDAQAGEEVSAESALAALDDQQAKNAVQQSENAVSSAEVALSRLQNRDLPQAREALSQAATRAEIAESVYESAREEQLKPAEELLEEAKEEEKKAKEFYEEQQALHEAGDIDDIALEAAREQWEQALEKLEEARDERDRIALEVENLARERDIARSQERAARTALNSLENEELEQARLNVAQAQTQLEQALLALDQTILKAPFDGVVTEIAVNTGQYVAMGEPVVTIIPATGNTFIEAQVDEEFTGRIMTGQEIVVSSAAFPDQLFDGKVDRVSPTVDPERGTFQVKFMLDRFEANLIPDLAVSVEIVTGRLEDSLIIDPVYTFRENDRIYVFLEDSGHVKSQEIVVEDLGRGEFLVLEGLKPGDRVLTDLDLEDGQRIRLN